MNLLNKNKIHFTIAGGFTYPELITLLIKFKNKYNLSVYDGLNYCSWNGGRINRNVFYDENIHNLYKKYNIGIALTFSNNIIDLNDKTGNNLLEIFHDSNNYIILINNNLRKYIRKYYSKYKLIYSITGVCLINVPMQEYDINFYKQLEDDYDYIVPRFEHIFDDNFIKLDQSKYEIMLNDTCVYNCKYWKEHFEADAKINRICAGKNPWETLGYNKCHKIEECWLKDFDPNIGDLETIKKYASNYGMDLKKDQINRLINQGINRFKIMGRENTKEELFESVNNYLLFNKIK